jgi:hypothetical protein
MGMFQLMRSHFIFLDSVKAILVHRAHRLLSGLNRILCTLRLARVLVRVDHVASLISGVPQRTEWQARMSFAIELLQSGHNL